MAPLDLHSISGTLAYNLIFLLLGAGFGVALELSGFGDTRKLAAQFYFRDMTVLKVMFTGIIVAATLIFLSSALGLLDFNKLWVNPTYVWPGILGGLIMGVGFILGGFCPGTSVVAASTLKLDGIVFVVGVLAGVFAFGETVHSFDAFWHSSALGRFTLPELFGVSTGTVLVLLVLMALSMFWAAEKAENYFAHKDLGDAAPAVRKSRGKIVAALALILLAVTAALIGQPTVMDRWQRISGDGEKLLTERQIFVSPREVVDLKKDSTLSVAVYDLRSEQDFNLFHIQGSRSIRPEQTTDPTFIRSLTSDPDNTIHFLIGNGEIAATDAWRLLKAQGVLNLYIVEGGINGWLDAFRPEECVAQKIDRRADGQDDAPAYRFAYAVGDRIAQAHPDHAAREALPPCAAPSGSITAHATETAALEGAPPAYEKKVKLQKKTVVKGGCG